MALHTGYAATMRTTVRDVIKHPWRNLAGIVVIAFAVAFSIAGTSYWATVSQSPGIEANEYNNLTYVGGQCEQDLGGSNFTCNVNGQVVKSENFDRSDKQFADLPPLRSEAVKEAESALSDGTTIHYIQSQSGTVGFDGREVPATITQYEQGDIRPEAIQVNPGEIVLNKDDAERIGASIGDKVQVSVDFSQRSEQPKVKVKELRVVGFTGSYSGYTVAPSLIGPEEPGYYNYSGSSGFLNGEQLRWEDVLELNKRGFVLMNSYFYEHKPPLEQIPAQYRNDADPEFDSWFSFSNISSSLRHPAAIALMLLFWLALFSVNIVLAILILTIISPVFTIAAARQNGVYSLMRSQGATRGHIRFAVLTYGFLNGLLGAVLGLLLGLVSGFVITKVQFPQWPFRTEWQSLLLYVLVAIVGGVCATVIPAFLQARQDIIAGVQGASAGRLRRFKKWMLIGPVGLAVLMLGTAYSYWRSGVYTLSTVWDGHQLIVMALLPFWLIFLVACAPWIIYLLGSARMALPVRLAGRQLRRDTFRSVAAYAAISSLIFIGSILSIMDNPDVPQTMKEDFSGNIGIISGQGYLDTDELGQALSEINKYIPTSNEVALYDYRTKEDHYGNFQLSPRTMQEYYSDETQSPAFVSRLLNDKEFAEQHSHQFTSQSISEPDLGLGYGEIVTDPDFVQLLNLDDATKAEAQQVLEDGGVLAPKNPNKPLVTTDTLTYETYDDDTVSKEVQVAHVLPQTTVHLAVSKKAAEDMGLVNQEYSRLAFTYGSPNQIQIALASRKADQLDTYLRIPTSKVMQLLYILSAIGLILVVIIMIIILSWPNLKSMYSQLSAVGSSRKQLRVLNGTYYAVLSLGATIPAMIVSGIFTLLSKDRGLISASGQVLRTDAFDTFSFPWLSVILFAVVLPALTYLIGWLFTPKVGVSYRKD